MYVVDITRDDDLENDMLIGNDSMSAKSKTINYIMDYVFANYNISLNKDIEIIKNQEKHSTYKNHLTETPIEIDKSKDIKITFKGKIDKLSYNR